MNNTLEKLKRVFAAVVAAIAIFMMIFTVISVTTFNRNDRSLFGFKAFIVLSGSMEATDFAAGDVVFVRNVDPTTLQEGDIIAFYSQNSVSYGEVVTHKIRAKTVDANGDPGFITYGTTTGTDDETIVTYPYINGKYQFHIPKIGAFFNDFLKTTPGYIVCILIPFLLLIGMQGLDTVKLFRTYRKEQMEEIEAQRAKLEEEKQQSAAMMEELLRLKEQLANSTAAQPAGEKDETEPEPEEETKTEEETEAAVN